MVHRSIPAPFLTKTYEMLDDHTSDDVVSWSSDGTAFVVWKTAEFAADLLPKYFKHNNFSSFVRQLNTYGFRKIVPNKWEFANENFRRGRQELLAEIRRRKPVPLPSTKFQAVMKCGAAISPSNSNSGEDMGSTSTSSAGPILANTAQVAKLCDENERLRRDNEILSSELAQVKRKCDEMVAFLSDCVNVSSDQKNGIICSDIIAGGHEEGEYYEEEDDNEDEEESKELHLKLFGVWLTGNGKKAKVEIGEERTCKKVGDFCAPPLLPAEAGKVCH